MMLQKTTALTKFYNGGLHWRQIITECFKVMI